MCFEDAIDIRLPPNSLVVLVGAAGSGKSSFAARHFVATQVLSSDRFREMIADDASDQSVSAEAFELLYLAARRRLERGRLTVVDATSATREARARLLTLARETHAPTVAIVLDVPLADCVRRDAARPRRHVPPDVIATQVKAVTDSLGTLAAEGFDRVYVLRGTRADVEAKVSIVTA